MSDTCSLSINYRARDQKVFDENDFLDEYADAMDDDHPVIRARYFEEVNYAGYRELEKIAAAGVEFYGEHGNGGDYGAMEFVTHRGDILYHAMGKNGERIVTVQYDLDDNPQVTEEDIDHARLFNDETNRLIKLFEQEKVF